MKKQNARILLTIGIIILVILLLPSLKLTPKFIISDSDFILDGPVTLLNYTINETDNTIITFSWIENISATMQSSTIFYTIGNSADIYLSIPYPEGTNTINKFQIVIQEDNITAILTKWYTIYTREIQIVQNYTNITGPTVYQNQTIYVQNKTNVSVPGPTVYVNQTITTEPTLSYIFETYQYYILGIGAIIIGYFIFWRKKK